MQQRKHSTFGRPVPQQQQQQQQPFKHQKQLFLGLSAFERHKKLLNECITLYGGRLPTVSSQLQKTDRDILQEQHRFIRSEEDDASNTWETKLARKYYSQLFREYCIADLSRYQEGKIGLRWRIQAELVNGKGQFVCGAKSCQESRALSSFEVNFAYEEAGQSKQALVKLRVCPKHAEQLNHKKHHKLVKTTKKRKRGQRTGHEAGDKAALDPEASLSPELYGRETEAANHGQLTDEDIISQLLS